MTNIRLGFLSISSAKFAAVSLPCRISTEEMVNIKSVAERIKIMDRPSWIYIEKICKECPDRENCPIEDLSAQKCEFLESRLPESLRQFFAQKREVMKRLRGKQRVSNL